MSREKFQYRYVSIDERKRRHALMDWMPRYLYNQVVRKLGEGNGKLAKELWRKMRPGQGVLLRADGREARIVNTVNRGIIVERLTLLGSTATYDTVLKGLYSVAATCGSEGVTLSTSQPKRGEEYVWATRPETHTLVELPDSINGVTITYNHATPGKEVCRTVTDSLLKVLKTSFRPHMCSVGWDCYGNITFFPLDLELLARRNLELLARRNLKLPARQMAKRCSCSFACEQYRVMTLRSINISSASEREADHTAGYSLHYAGRAVDINRINEKRVDRYPDDLEVRCLVMMIQSKVLSIKRQLENFGPYHKDEGHKNHIHIGIK